MKQIEITTRVNSTLEESIKVLESKGFKRIRESRIEDKYLTSRKDELNKNNILEILSSCVLLRYLNVNQEQIFKKITYKKKVYEDNMVVTEEKINLNCEDLKKAEELFIALNFSKLIDVNYNVVVMAKGNIEYAFQEVENLGLLVEYENSNDFEGVSNERIKQEKLMMLDELRSNGLDITDEYDVKKAYELIQLSLN